MGTEDLLHSEYQSAGYDDSFIEQQKSLMHQQYASEKQNINSTIFTMSTNDTAELEQFQTDSTTTKRYFSICLAGLEFLTVKNLDLNHLYLLELISLGVLPVIEGRLKDWAQTLIRKGYLTIEHQLTLKGEALLINVQEGIEPKQQTLTKSEDPFEKWWSLAYPSTDRFQQAGRLFFGTQKKHLKKEKCRKLFWENVNQLKIDGDDIFWATTVQVEEAKLDSFQKNQSQLKFIPNSYDYLDKQCFLPFIEAGRQRRNKTTIISKDPFSFNI
ncbi:hypothetical protein HGH93_23585 [Chitinophaga polysaccharea]|uniref:hypothetical protein n=1 Tax=Chitinophaga polysaccharea TaxID=1293035 RepID=UPI001454FDEA|nr:hypothetical protein [Chitinophaga polysaccharea]NLR61104.1 hypothetical protein [Chitinophaga polysaccharea]